jgi:hypothetical protein
MSAFLSADSSATAAQQAEHLLFILTFGERDRPGRTRRRLDDGIRSFERSTI